MSKHKVNVTLIPDNGVWVAHIPAFGLATQGDSPEHALSMAKEVVELHLENPQDSELELLDAAYSTDASLEAVEVDVSAAEEARTR